MAARTYLKDFQDNYEHPQVDALIVGFSGIDPQRKSSLSEAQKAIVRQLIQDALSVIDFSKCECNPTQLTDEQKSVISKLIEEKLNELDTCDCDKSSLSDEQKSLIHSIIDKRLEELIINYDGGEIDPHEDNPEPVPTPEPVNPSDINHEQLSGLLGGDSNGHLHLTKEEFIKLAAYPKFSDIKHENLPDLLGGNSDGHLHLTSDELKKLRIMIETFFPDGSEVVIIKPVSPVTPDEPPDEYDPYGGLPSGTPPAWEIKLLPTGYNAMANSCKMYCGDFFHSTYQNGLFVKLTGNKLFNTTDLETWNNVSILAGIANSSYRFVQYLKVPGGIINTNTQEVMFLVIQNDANNYSSSSVPYVCKRSDGYTYSTLVVTTKGTDGYRSARFVAACYSELLKCVLFIADNNYVYKRTIGASSNIRIYDTTNLAITVNPGCAAWHPTTAVFCLTGLEGTSTSYDGETWTLNSDAPHNLLELSYREDLDSFVARSGEDKTFYASPDGINWQQLSDTPVPLDNISTVHYNPDNKWYCAVGIGDGNAYFSKDLKHWIPTKLRNNSPVDVGDVIYMPSTGLYVAMPTSGNYYYTFNPSNWTD